MESLECFHGPVIWICWSPVKGNGRW